MPGAQRDFPVPQDPLSLSFCLSQIGYAEMINVGLVNIKILVQIVTRMYFARINCAINRPTDGVRPV